MHKKTVSFICLSLIVTSAFSAEKGNPEQSVISQQSWLSEDTKAGLKGFLAHAAVGGLCEFVVAKEANAEKSIPQIKLSHITTVGHVALSVTSNNGPAFNRWNLPNAYIACGNAVGINLTKIARSADRKSLYNLYYLSLGHCGVVLALHAIEKVGPEKIKPFVTG